VGRDLNSAGPLRKKTVLKKANGGVNHGRGEERGGRKRALLKEDPTRGVEETKAGEHLIDEYKKVVREHY